MTHTLFFLEGAEHEAMVRWACERIPWMGYSNTMRAVGIGDTRPDGSVEHLAVCLYHSFVPVKMIDGKPWYGICEISFAAASPKWATRRTISNLLRIPFEQYNVRKVVTVIPSSNTRAIEFNKGIGLKWEASLRHHFARGVHAQIHGMMKSEYEARWKNPRAARRISPRSGTPDGQEHTRTAAAA